MRRIVTLIAVASLAACAHAAPMVMGPPSLETAAGAPAPPQARFYADCIAQAAGRGSFDREANLIRFKCDGAPAAAFYDGLAAYSALIGSEITRDGRTWRFTQKLMHDPSGLDYCVKGETVDCTVVLNVGEFLAQP